MVKNLLLENLPVSRQRRDEAAKRRGENCVPKIRKFNSAPHSGQNPNLF